MSVVKPDGRRVFNNCVLTDPGQGRFQSELTNQILARRGMLSCQFTVYNDVVQPEIQVLSTKIFYIAVTETLVDYDALESTNEYGAAVILFQYAEEMQLRTMAMDALLTKNLDMKISDAYNGLMSGCATIEDYLNSVLDIKISTVYNNLNNAITNVKTAFDAELDTLLGTMLEAIANSAPSGGSNIEIFNTAGLFSWTIFEILRRV